jgi:sugar (pentulose or hexulose) kinase
MGGGSKNRIFCTWLSNAIRIPVFACEGEITSVGNFIMQLIGTGELNSVKEREILLKKSIMISQYNTDNSDGWDEAYNKYLRFIEM